MAAPDNGHGQPLTGLARLGGLHFRRWHLRLLTVGPCRSHVKGRLSLAPMGPQPLALAAIDEIAFLRGVVRRRLGRQTPILDFGL